MLLARHFSTLITAPAPGLAAAGGLTAEESALLAAEARAALAAGLIGWDETATPVCSSFAVALDGAAPPQAAVMVPPDAAQLAAHLRLLALRADMDDIAPPAVIVPVEHPEAFSIAGQPAAADAARVTAEFGRRQMRLVLESVMDACDRDHADGFDPARHAPLGVAVRMAAALGVPDAAIAAAIARAADGDEHFTLLDAAPLDDATSRHLPVALSLPDVFFESALTRHGFAEGGMRQSDAAALLDTLSLQIWQSGQPHIVFRDRAGAVPPAPDAPVARGSIRLVPFIEANGFQAPAFAAAVRVLVLQLASRGTDYVAVDLTDIAGALMAAGIAYDSARGRAMAAGVAALMTAETCQTLADLAARSGRPGHGDGRQGFCQHLKAVRDRMAGGAFAGLAPGLPDFSHMDAGLRRNVAESLDRAIDAVRRHGLQAWPLTRSTADTDSLMVLATGQMPLATLVQQDEDGHRLAAPVQLGLARLGYDADQREAMAAYVLGTRQLDAAPGVDTARLRERGLDAAAITRIEAALPTARHLDHAINIWTLGRAFCRDVLRLPEDADDVLLHLGFTADDIAAASAVMCGTGQLAGAPHLRPEHASVFATDRAIAQAARLSMQAAIESGLTAGARQVLTLDPGTPASAVRGLILGAWEAGVSGLALYRSSSGLDAPINQLAASPSQRQVADIVEKSKKQGH